MFYVEEDITPAVNAASSIFGRVGKILTGKDVLYNATIITREFGKIWQGDIDLRDHESKLNLLSTRLKTAVYLFDPSNEFNFKKAVVFNTQITEVSD